MDALLCCLGRNRLNELRLGKKVSDRTAFNRYFYYDRESEYLRYDVIVAPEKKDISVAHSSRQNVGFA